MALHTRLYKGYCLSSDTINLMKTETIPSTLLNVDVLEVFGFFILVQNLHKKKVSKTLNQFFCKNFSLNLICA